MKKLTLDEIKRAFSIMGEFLRDKKTVGEIAVYRCSAILLQFRWRHSTRDVDAIVVSDGNHGLVQQAGDQAATVLGLERSWLSEAVSQYTSRSEEHTSELQSRGELVCRLLLEKKKDFGYSTVATWSSRRKGADSSRFALP